MLFRQATLTAIAEGQATVAFRRWRRPASPTGLWTQIYLALLENSPGVRAPSLANEVGVDAARFKANFREFRALRRVHLVMILATLQSSNEILGE